MPEPINQEQAMRFNRQIVLPQIDLSGQEHLLNASILVIGAGGLGCSAAQLLCTSGVGKLTLVDDDTVEVTNLPRQILFSESDVGKRKVDAARQRLTQLNSHCVVRAIPQRLDSTKLLSEVRQHTLVVDCTDNLTARLQINKVCSTARIPLVSGAAIRFEGQLFATLYQKDASCYECVSALTHDAQLSCTEAGVFSPVVAIIGAQQALIAMQIVAGIGSPAVNKLQLFDALTGQWQQFTVPRSSHCSICQD